MKPNNERTIDQPGDHREPHEEAPREHPFSREDQIRLRAYWLHLEGGSVHGFDVNDWLLAEKQIGEETS